MNIHSAALAATAVRPDQFPADGSPEVAFVGKSNVGKSSLINAMLNRKMLARVSQQPGKTRTINFYDVEYGEAHAATPSEGPPGGAALPLTQKIRFVDLPGYGYAKVSKTESAQWGQMVEGYLKNRSSLVLMLLLLDIRHEPNANDRMLYEWCRYYQLPLTLVATKSDKLKRSQIPKHLAILRRALPSSETPLPFSSETRDGRDALWSLIMDMRERSMV